MFNEDGTDRVFRVSYSSPSRSKWGNTTHVIAKDGQSAVEAVLAIIPDAAIVAIHHLGDLLRPVEKAPDGD